MNAFPTSAAGTDQADALKRRLDLLGYAGVVVLALATYYCWGPRFFDPYLQSDDTRIVIYPFWSYHSDLFQGDYLAEAMKTLAPPLYRGVIFALTLFLDLLTVPKVIQLFTIAWCALHGFRMGGRRGGGMGGLLGVYLVLHSYPILDRTGGGLPRAFAFPVMLMLADAIDARHERRGGLATILGFALYPPAGMLASLVYGGWMGGRIVQAWRQSGGEIRTVGLRAGPLIAVAAISFAVLIPSMLPGRSYGRIHTVEEVREMPAFGPQGRTHLVPLLSLREAVRREFPYVVRPSADSLPARLLGLPFDGQSLPMAVIIVLAGLLLLRFAPFELALPFAFFGVGLFGFELANALAFRLYDPGRMLTLSLPVAGIVLLLRASTVGGGRDRADLGGRYGAAAAFGVLVIIQGAAFRDYPHLNVDAREQKPVFELVQSLPENALIAGHPRRMDNIPLWGKRPILISEETSQPWFTGIWEETERRLQANLDAYYATSLDPIRRMREHWPVTHMLVHEDDVLMTSLDDAELFEPYGGMMRELADRARGEIIWEDAPEGAVIGRAAGFTLYDLQELETLLSGDAKLGSATPEP